MSTNPSPTTRRFVRAAWLLLAFQLVAAAGATGLAVWAASEVRRVIDERDALSLRMREIEARQPAPVTAEPEFAPAPAEPAIVTETEPVAEPVAEPVPAPRPIPVRPVRTRPPEMRPTRVPPVVTQPVVPTPTPVIVPDKPVATPPRVVEEAPPPTPPRRRRPRFSIDVFGVGVGGRRERETPTTPPNRNPNNPPRTQRPTTSVPVNPQPTPNTNTQQPPRIARPATTVNPNAVNQTPNTTARRRRPQDEQPQDVPQ